MVLKGQFLERPALIPVGSSMLEGVWHRGQRGPPLLVLPPPPDEGGGMDHVVAAEVAWAVAHAGHPVLRFNFRGVAGSQGTRGGPAEQLEDAGAALDLVEENTGALRIAVASLGGSAVTALALERARATVATVCLISPTGVLPSEIQVPVLAVAGAEDLRIPHRVWADALARSGGRLERIDHADGTFLRNLPEVGMSVLKWLES